MWSTVQAAITGGWATTIRLIAIMTVGIVMIDMLGIGTDIPIAAFLQVLR